MAVVALRHWAYAVALWSVAVRRAWESMPVLQVRAAGDWLTGARVECTM